MKRYKYLLVQFILYPEDIFKLKTMSSELKTLSDIEVQELYRYFSEDLYGSSWMNLTEELSKKFVKWVNEGSDDDYVGPW